MITKMSGKKSLFINICLISLFMFAVSMQADKTEDEIKKLQNVIKEKGYSFTVGRTGVSHIPLEKLCGLKEPKDWRKKGKFDEGKRLRKVTLPSSFDWRSRGYVTSVKNQGGCGSCWAFATIGSYEGAIAVQFGSTNNLSEQYLLDCNTKGYSCSGGWWDFDDMRNGTPKLSCYPYTAVKAACKQTCPKFYPVSTWYYVGSSHGVPNVDDIKNAIYDHGPVAVAVYVDSHFQHYTGGIFDACTPGTVNHGVVLTGWDDAGGYWILKNSWGTGWGENGYMRIRYNCSSVGYASAYAVPKTDSIPKFKIIEAVNDSNNCLHVWGIGTDNTQYLTWRNKNGEWSGWMPNWNNSPKLVSVTAVNDSNNCLHVWGIGTDNTQYLTWRNKNGNWSPWMANWNNSPKLVSVTAVNDSNNCLHVWGIGTDNTQYLTWRNKNGTWSAWMANWNNSPKLVSVTAVNDSNNCLHTWGIGTDNTQYLTWRNKNGNWSAWMANWNSSPKLVSVTAVNDSNNCLHVWGIGTNNTQYLTWRNKNGNWSIWIPNWN
jgi:C1A family cysteine protease